MNTPYAMWFGYKPNLSQLSIFGALPTVIYHIPLETKKIKSTCKKKFFHRLELVIARAYKLFKEISV